MRDSGLGRTCCRSQGILGAPDLVCLVPPEEYPAGEAADGAVHLVDDRRAAADPAHGGQPAVADTLGVLVAGGAHVTRRPYLLEN